MSGFYIALLAQMQSLHSTNAAAAAVDLITVCIFARAEILSNIQESNRGTLLAQESCTATAKDAYLQSV